MALRFKVPLILLLALIALSCNQSDGKKSFSNTLHKNPDIPDKEASYPAVDTALYNKLQLHLVHNKPTGKWPVKTAYPLPGAILPFKRIVAYYGNFYAKGMGILGELPPDEMLERLQEEAQAWQHADPLIPVQPALEYIAVSAQGKAGASGKYCLRMPFSQIDKALALAKKIDAIVILDIQVGHSNLQTELPLLLPYLRRPDVHLAIDPEYSMKNGERPCAAIGTFDATDINYASAYLAQVVKQNNLPPKVLVVHRFTKNMLTNYRNVVLHREVQLVINMDGFGFPAKKINSYRLAISAEPIEFAGFKLFYKNDVRDHPHKLMQPSEILSLYPSPIYIQYQ